MRVHLIFISILFMFVVVNFRSSSKKFEEDIIIKTLETKETFDIVNIGSSRAAGIKFPDEIDAINMSIPMQNYEKGRLLFYSYLESFRDSTLIVPIDYFTFCSIDDFPLEPYLIHLSPAELGISRIEHLVRLRLPYFGMNNMDPFVRSLIKRFNPSFGIEESEPEFSSQAIYLAESDKNRLNRCLVELESQLEVLKHDIHFFDSLGVSVIFIMLPYHSEYAEQLDLITNAHELYIEKIHSTGIEVIDLRKYFISSEDTLFSDPYHLNSLGNEILSKEIIRLVDEIKHG